MDSLKALVAQKRKITSEVYEGKKYVKRADLEAAELRRLREEEQRELEAKAARKKQADEEEAQRLKRLQAQKEAAQKEEEENLPALSPQEVIRRLRLLGQPATFFGETDFDRLKRLKKAEQEVQLEDEAAGGGMQNNLALELQRQEAAQQEAQKRRALAAGEAGKAEGGDAKSGGNQATQEDAPGDELQRAFARAAALVKEKQQEDAMSDAEKVIKYVKRWTKEWEAEVEGMAPEVLATGAGRQTKMSFQHTKMAFDSMYRQLGNGTLDKSLTSGLWRLLSAMQQRDYLKASEIYMQLAIGNAPWPIGVTSVGIHERSAREKISHVMNTDSTAHIMTDEATRRSLQGIKRLMTFVQRTYPSDPSKSMEYNGFQHTAPAALATALPQIEYKPS